MGSTTAHRSQPTPSQIFDDCGHRVGSVKGADFVLYMDRGGAPARTAWSCASWSAPPVIRRALDDIGRRSILPQMEVRLSLQDMSQPASHDHPEHSCLSRGHCSHIPARYWSALHRWRASRLPCWQPAHATGGCRKGTSKQWPVVLPRPASASVLMAQLAWSLSSKLLGSGSRSRVDHVQLKNHTHTL